MNFPAKFIRLIRKCITKTRFSIKVNGGLNGYFKGAKGLRQGDHLSPYLFFICMNVLSCLFAHTLSDFNYHWKCKGMKLTHLYYADDVLLFSHGDRDSILHVMSYLSKFSRPSGLSPSVYKSTIFMSNCEVKVLFINI